MIALIRFEFCKCLTRLRIIGIRRINMRLPVNLTKPFLCLSDHLRHMLIIRTEDNIFPGRILHVPFKYLIQTVCVFKSPPQGIKLLFPGITDGFALRPPYPPLVFLQILLIRINR